MKQNDFGQLGKSATLYQRVLAKFPLTYMGIMTRMVGRGFETILDVGCGTGTPMELIKIQNPEIRATGADVYEPYLKEAEKKGIYEKLVHTNVTELPFAEREFDVVVCFHVIEHLEKEAAWKLLEKLESLAKKRVVVAMPVGDLPQDEYEGNPYQKHLSVWYPDELQKRGYRVVGQGLKAIYGTDNMVLKYGKIMNFVFAIAMLFQPLLYVKPEWGVFMIAQKEIV
jgi:SAM-dependent methyltransferase